MAAYGHRSRFWWLVPAVGIALFLVWRYWPPAEIVPAPANPFVSQFAFQRIDPAGPVSDAIEVFPKSGWFATITFFAAADVPEQLDGAEVRPAEKWPLAIMVYPRGAECGDKGTVRFPCNRFVPPGYKPPMAPFRGPPPEAPFQGLAGLHRIWWECGYKTKTAPKATEPWPAEEHRFWTYIAAPNDEPGDYVYELTLYPTCHWKSSIRYDAGPPVVLQRGLLRIVPLQE